MRYKGNKPVSPTVPPIPTNSSPVPTPTTPYNPPASTGRHLKKDGTPDMRYKENRTPGFDKDGSPDKRYKQNKP
ncbi:hypothetical protein A0256_13900 [Mucilaginibacter sp. PAMC 26640]|nr:hypothetical protein A0256_13900 [Mucilaginibacter sp. PAMC 26640]